LCKTAALEAEPRAQYARFEGVEARMSKRSIGKVVANGNSKQITIPRPMLHALGWQLGTQVLLEVREGCLVVAEVERAFVERALTRISHGTPRPLSVLEREFRELEREWRLSYGRPVDVQP
jgi:antitoxin component of MazEF toxin-antitoxin module